MLIDAVARESVFKARHVLSFDAISSSDSQAANSSCRPSSLADQHARASAESILRCARSRVYSRLNRATQFPIAVVTAPQGFGKSTVLREYFALQRHASRALTLTPKQADLLAFMRSLAVCVSDVAPALLTSFIGVYDRVKRADDAARTIAQWAAAHLRSAPVSILIDGLEHSTDQRVFTLVGELIDLTLEAPVQWVIVARNVSGFPVARWLADDRMDLPIDEVDLALTVDDFCGPADDELCSISREHAYALCSSAAQWPAAVALLLSIPGDLPAQALTVTQPQTYTRFAAYAFSARTLREQNLLLETCLYTSFDAALLGAAGWTDVDALLTGLREAGAFLFVDADGAYHYDEQFSDFLVQRLKSSTPQAYTGVAAATAEVFRRVGRWSDALHLYIDLHAKVPLASLLSEHGFELMDRGESDTVSHGLASLSEAEFGAFPVALALKASMESLYGSFDVAEAWFRHAIKNAGNSTQRGTIVFRFATDLVRRDRRDAIELLQPIVEEGGHAIELAVSLAGLLATAYATNNMTAQADKTIADALEQMIFVSDVSIRAKLYYQTGYVALFAHDSPRAKSYALRALDTALTAQLYDIAARALSILYNIAMDYEDDIAASRSHLEQLASCSIKAGSRRLFMYAVLGQYEIEVLAGNLVESARLDAALQSLEVDYSVIATETLLPAQALRATWSGDFHRAYRLIASTAAAQITPLRQARRYAEIALYAAAAGLRSEAAAAATAALAVAPKTKPADNAVTFTKAYIALTLTLLGRRSRAVQLLRRLKRTRTMTPRLRQLIHAIESINERWTRGRYCVNLVAVLARLNTYDFGGIARLLEALPLPETSRGQFAELTSTEREVLIHMSAGLESNEIAAMSRVGREIVETAIVSLCRKLGCRSPRHAVALMQSAAALETAYSHGR